MFPKEIIVTNKEISIFYCIKKIVPIHINTEIHPPIKRILKAVPNISFRFSILFSFDKSRITSQSIPKVIIAAYIATKAFA